MSKYVKIKTVNANDKLTYLLEMENGKYFISVSVDNDALGCHEIKRVEMSVNGPRLARRMFKIIYKNGVYPCHLSDIVNDLLC